jgi:hypothetical protein
MVSVVGGTHRQMLKAINNISRRHSKGEREKMKNKEKK